MTREFPPENYIKVESNVPGIEVYAPAPEKKGPHRPVVDFNCPQCGATTAYSLASGGLECAHCGYFEPPPREVVGRGAEDFEFKVETVTREAHGWGTGRRDLVCENCGAVSSLPQDALTAACPFCASNKVIQREDPQEVLRPRFLVPFQLDEETASRIAREWLGSSWMVPAEMKTSVSIGAFTPVYLPYWTFDADADAFWQADVGYNETHRHYNASTKSWETRTTIRWRHENGRVRQRYDDMLIPGTARLSRLHLDGIRLFNLNELIAYSPEYLAGIVAQAFDVPLETAWDRGRSAIREDIRRLCRDEIRGDHVRNFEMALDYADESWRYVLLPVLVNAFRYRGETYRMLINGQTGAISGQRPVDWQKIWLLIAAMLAPGVLTGLAGIFLLLLGPVGPVVAVIGFVLFLLGAIGSGVLYSKAAAMDDI